MLGPAPPLHIQIVGARIRHQLVAWPGGLDDKAEDALGRIHSLRAVLGWDRSVDRWVGVGRASVKAWLASGARADLQDLERRLGALGWGRSDFWSDPVPVTDQGRCIQTRSRRPAKARWSPAPLPSLIGREIRDSYPETALDRGIRITEGLSSREAGKWEPPARRARHPRSFLS